jgi:hypothetical protein
VSDRYTDISEQASRASEDSRHRAAAVRDRGDEIGRRLTELRGDAPGPSSPPPAGDRAATAERRAQVAKDADDRAHVRSREAHRSAATAHEHAADAHARYGHDDAAAEHRRLAEADRAEADG